MKQQKNIEQNLLENENFQEKQEDPIISVVMPCYNRQEYIADAIESILNQTYSNFEFIIIDDCSTDNTYKIAKKYTEIDKRIILLKNETNQGIVYTLNKGFNLAKGKYIARMDDDDISLPERFEKQLKYMENHSDIVVLGAMAKTFCKDYINDNYIPWITECDSDILSIISNFSLTVIHPLAFIRKDFLIKNNLKYNHSFELAEEFYLWYQILNKGGKIANISDILLKHRLSLKSISRDPENNKQRLKNVQNIRNQQLKRFFKHEQIEEIFENNKFWWNFNYSFKRNYLYKILTKMKDMDTQYIYSKETYQKTIEKYCGIESKMHIFFAINNNYTQHLCVSIASILKNSIDLDSFNFYILDGGINQENKLKILSLKNIKYFNIEFITIDKNVFKQCQIPKHYNNSITKETYYRYLIPYLKPNLEKVLYLDSDVIIEDSLNLLWNTNLQDTYAAVVLDSWQETHNYYKRKYGLSNAFNAGVMLINNKKWVNENLTKKLFFNTNILNLRNAIRWVDQDVLNYTIKENFIILPFKYNIQSNHFFTKEQFNPYNQNHLGFDKQQAVIIHFTGSCKPWTHATHPLWYKYWEYILYTPFKEKYNTEYQKLKQKVNLNLYGAKERIQQHLSYQLGQEIIKAKTLIKIIILPYILLKIIKKYSYEKKIKNTIFKLYPHLIPAKLEDYMDYQEALKIQNYLSYKLGNLLIKHPFTFVFRVAKVYKEWKKEINKI